MNAELNRLERRGAQRFAVHMPVSVEFEGRSVAGFVQDLSGRGIFFYAETALPEGAVIHLTFTMPSEITLAESMPVRCRGRVLRASDPQSGEHRGIAVQLDSYEFLPQDRSVSQFARVTVATPATTTAGPASR
jgi:hypothetical protein